MDFGNFDSFSGLFGAFGKLYSDQHELAAIWLNTPVQTATERTVRIAPGHLVTIENGNLIDCVNGNATHKVIGCMGTLVNQFELIVTDLQTNEPSIIKL